MQVHSAASTDGATRFPHRVGAAEEGAREELLRNDDGMSPRDDDLPVLVAASSADELASDDGSPEDVEVSPPGAAWAHASNVVVTNNKIPARIRMRGSAELVVVGVESGVRPDARPGSREEWAPHLTRSS